MKNTVVEGSMLGGANCKFVLVCALEAGGMFRCEHKDYKNMNLARFHKNIAVIFFQCELHHDYNDFPVMSS